MVSTRINMGTKDAILAIAVMIVLGMTIIFQWSIWELMIIEGLLVLVFYAGGKKQDKHVEETFEKMNTKNK